MNEKQAREVADALGGETWQSGGDVWLVVLRRADGRVVVVSEEVVCEYTNEDEMEVGEPSASVVLH